MQEKTTTSTGRLRCTGGATFPGVNEANALKNSSEKLALCDSEAPPLSRGNSGDFEPSSVCLAKMVLNFIEDNNNGEKQRCGRSRCSCFTGSGTESSDDESEWCDDLKCSSSEACEILKSLVLCTSVCERNLMAHVTKIVETSKRKDESCLKFVADGLVSLGYDAALCKSRWEKSHMTLFCQSSLLLLRSHVNQNIKRRENKKHKHFFK